MDIQEKTPEDQFNIFVFFDGDLDEAESISGFTVYSGNIDTGAISTSSIVAATSQVDQYIEIVLLAGQALGERHKLTVVAYSDFGRTYEKDIMVKITAKMTGDFTKQPAEQFVIGFDFSPHMEVSETLDESTITVTAVDANTGDDVTALVISASGVDTDATNKIVRVAVLGGLHGDFINISVEVSCTDQVLSKDKTFSRTVAMQIYEDGYYGAAIAWDAVNSDSEVAASSSASVAITGGGGPFTWEVTGTDFTLANAVTGGLTNQLVAGASAEGDAAITVTNAQGQIANGVVTVPFGNISFAAPVSFLYGLAYDEITGNLLSLKNSDGTVYIHDGISENVGSTIDIGTSVNDIAVFGGNLYSQDVPLTDFKKFVGISATVDSSFDSDSLGLNYCLCVEFNAAGDMITMALDDDTARQHTGFSGTIEDSFAITANMVGGTIDRDTGNVILSDWSTDMITVFDGFSDTVLDSFPAPVSGGCYGMVVVDGNLITTGGGRIYLHDGISEYTGD